MLDQCRPDDVALIANYRTANALLHLQAQLILKMKEEGLLSERDAHHELEMITENQYEVQFHYPKRKLVPG